MDLRENCSAEQALQELERGYGAPGRHYHDWGHVWFCLCELDRVRSLCHAPLAVEMALWFHDAVYEPAAADNEERSAALAARWAECLGWPGERIAQVRSLVLATRLEAGRRGSGADGDAQLIRDIDLAVLGRSRQAFRRYEAEIRREYAAVPWERFREGRSRLLRTLLDRPRLYQTEPFRRRYEERARRNLRWSLEGLARRRGG